MEYTNWVTIYTIDIPLPPPRDRVRIGVPVSHSDPNPCEECKLMAVKQLVGWAETYHSPHPELPEYHGRSYLPRKVDLDCPLEQIIAQLRGMNVTITQDTSRYFPPERKVGVNHG